MRALDIAIAPRQNSRHWTQDTITWEQLLGWVENPGSEKACGNYVLGRIEHSTMDHWDRKACTDLHRRKGTVVARSAITLDADSARSSLPDQVSLVLGYQALVHTTYNSTPEAPRYRLLFPTDRDMTPEEYTRATTSLMRKLGQDQFDVGSAQPERYMFRPSQQRPDHFQHWVVDGDLISVDELLAEYVEAPQARVPAVDPVAADPAPDERYVQVTVAGVLADLVELADLPDGARTDRGDGWDSGVFRAACRLIEAANSCTVYTLDDAEKDFMEHAPAAAGTYDPAYKWSSAKRTVGDAPLAPQGRPREDFSPLTHADLRGALEGDSQDAGQGAERVGGASSWAGMDLTGYLDGSYQPPVPCLLTRDDGVSLLYPGLTHSIHGESESGKSMLVQHEAVRVMMAGGHVLYLDFESDPGSIVDRLVTLGASRKMIGEQFVYLQPSTDPDKYGPDLDALYATLGARPYKLAVIDGVSESMDVVTGESKDPNATAIEWTRKVPRRIADRTGAAVVQIDHVTKNAETRGRFAIGGQAKLSALTGAAYSLDVRQPLGRGLCGELVLRVAKDRPGYVRGRSGEHRASDRTQEAARVIVDSTGGGLVLTVAAPAAEATAEQAESLLMGRISDFLAELGEEHAGATTTTVRREVRGNNEDIDRAVQALVQQGHVNRTVKGQSHLHRLVKPYLPAQEDFKDD
ncbi:AAA family ATPase [Arthrobacter sp. ISL-65]|uniref:AAA family ATPase n=1 Tax=Arthrobacter sp. ISL-65 TaxID=2819112 RepID=UPI001BEA9FD2|nr:AAA family ATPase [Arthrobacter sp. ISL-65]MBT2549806.1 AAA family ATPase [Arthrobacter sp. ISL-65]